MLVKLLIAVVVLIALAQAYIRLAPLPAERLTARPGPMEVGLHPLAGGVKQVVPLADLAPDAFARLLAIAADTPRTRRIGADDDPAAFVTRTLFWGFPDISVIWADETDLHINAHLVFGGSDLGVNAARVSRWLERLEAADQGA